MTNDICPVCDGDGSLNPWSPVSQQLRCWRCGGSGELRDPDGNEEEDDSDD